MQCPECKQVGGIYGLSPVDIPSIPSDEPPLMMDEVMELRKFGVHRSPCAKCNRILKDKNGAPCINCAKVAEYNNNNHGEIHVQRI